MKYLALVSILYALSGCDDAPATTVVNDPRFAISTLPVIHTPAGYSDLNPVIIRDIKTGAEYLLLATSHGEVITKLDPVPVGPVTPEKAP